MLPNIQKMLAEIEDDAKRAKWSRSNEMTADLDASAYRGETDRWFIVVVDFSIEDQGFSAGSRGYDGVARKDLIVMHLPRENAERIFKLAQKNVN